MVMIHNDNNGYFIIIKTIDEPNKMLERKLISGRDERKFIILLFIFLNGILNNGIIKPSVYAVFRSEKIVLDSISSIDNVHCSYVQRMQRSGTKNNRLTLYHKNWITYLNFIRTMWSLINIANCNASQFK